jgi:hypothetical protein
LSNWSLIDIWLRSADDVTLVPGRAFTCLPLGKTQIAELMATATANGTVSEYLLTRCEQHT